MTVQGKEVSLLAKFDDKTQDILAGYYDILLQHGFIGTQTKGIPYHFTLGFPCVDNEEQTKNE